MPKKLYNIMPDFYPACIHDDCIQAGTCLHNIAYHRLCEKVDSMTLLNPQRCVKNADCQHYRSNTPVRYAFGFSSFKGRMLPGQWTAFVELLRKDWGRTRFYERQRGDIALPPNEQTMILDALDRVGATGTFEFDRYEDIMTWYE